jgi:hypothetical protein
VTVLDLYIYEGALLAAILMCAVLSAWRFPGSLAGVLAPLGFGLWFLTFCSRMILYRVADYHLSATLEPVLMRPLSFAALGCVATAMGAATAPKPTERQEDSRAALVRRRISTGFFVTSVALVGGFTQMLSAGVIAAAWSAARTGYGGLEDVLLPLLVLLVPSLYVGVVLLVLYYKMWAAIQDGHARTSPGAAVGFLFIPFYGLYWIFRVISGFAADYNRYIGRYSLAVPKLPMWLFIAYPIVILLGNAPFAGAVIGFFSYALMVAVVYKVCSAVNALPAISSPPPIPGSGPGPQPQPTPPIR